MKRYSSNVAGDPTRVGHLRQFAVGLGASFELLAPLIERRHRDVEGDLGFMFY
ncbi:MAG TPA: hypothetical protein VFE62_13890 [Gemmataceae bacterium]|nr:hypothetical protein [Gemmataceae bacterium]